MEELYIRMEEEFYLDLIAKELNGDISGTEKRSLKQWLKDINESGQILASPLLSLYLGHSLSMQRL